MKIAPPRGRVSVARDQQDRVQAWSNHLGRKLPADYRTFLIRYDGGSPYPNIFDEVTPDAVRRGPDTQAFCDVIYDLDYARSETDDATYGNAVPSGFIPIAQDPGGLEILLSLRDADFGHVFLWQGTTEPWGSEGNNENRLFRQASSFVAFLDSLYDTPDKIGYDQWATPWRVENAVELKLD